MLSLLRDRGRIPADPASDLTHPATLSAQDGDLLALGEEQVSTTGVAAAYRAAIITSSATIDPRGNGPYPLPGAP
jgi:hypothetical protein